ncbi:ABC transporter ATP-binding protein [candidate division KSB1 bacterium]|nr:ABC transporter ATP-binding protein [candidate division KSB1 bacterium]
MNENSSHAYNDTQNCAVKLHHVTKRYATLTAVDRLSLSIPGGTVFGFLGPNGAGKTTTINMICGLIKADEGSVQLLGRSMYPANDTLKSKIGVCPQEIIVWQKLTCLEQLQFIGQMYRVPAVEAKKRGQQLLYDMGLGDKTHKPAGTLSGGMQRRLNFIMALVHDPPIVILDEPEAGLDPQSRIMLREYIRSMAREKTVIFTTHNMDEAERVCDWVAIIDHGALLQLDTPANLKATIGGGHVLEIDVAGQQDLTELTTKIRQLQLTILTVGSSLVVRGANIIHHLGTVMQIIQQAGIDITEVKLRENSLEDVFIALTGRRLRE